MGFRDTGEGMCFGIVWHSSYDMIVILHVCLASMKEDSSLSEIEGITKVELKVII